MNPNIPAKCNGCGAALLLENLYVDDGCPCNTTRGVNFTPEPCALCRVDHCVKPGHRQASLFGDCVAVDADLRAKLDLAEELALALEHHGIVSRDIWEVLEAYRAACPKKEGA